MVRIAEMHVEIDRLAKTLGEDWTQAEACYIASCTLGKLLNGMYPIHTTFWQLGSLLAERLADESVRDREKEN